jgi:hypothetical protein
VESPGRERVPLPSSSSSDSSSEMIAARESRGAFGSIALVGAVVVVLFGNVLEPGTVVLASLKLPDAVGEESADTKDDGVVRGLIPFPRGVANAGPANEVLRGAAANELPKGAKQKEIES